MATPDTVCTLVPHFQVHDGKLGEFRALLQEALKIAQITRLEVHAPPAELDKLRAPLPGLTPQFFAVELGFRR